MGGALKKERERSIQREGAEQAHGRKREWAKVVGQRKEKELGPGKSKKAQEEKEIRPEGRYRKEIFSNL